MNKFKRVSIVVLRIFLTFLIVLFSASYSYSQTTGLASFQEAMHSGRDLWGEAAMAQKNGASYVFFEKIIPPLRYVNADFHYYPIVLSAANSSVKARLISNGSGINVKGGAKSWRDVGIPFLFRVGPDEFLFGSLKERLNEPTLADGWLPIVEICYSHRSPYQSEGMVPLDQERKEFPAEIYRLESFASTDSSLANNGTVFVKFDLKQGNNGYIAVEPGIDSMTFNNGQLLDKNGNILAFFDNSWKKEGKLIRAKLKAGDAATLAIATKPFPQTKFTFNGETYSMAREACISMWKDKLAKGLQISTPEPIVNNAYRNSLCQIFQLVNNDKIFYSSGNQYEKMYEAEGSDAVHALLNYGFETDMQQCMKPLFEFTRKGLELHIAGFKISNLCQYYWQTRDRAVVEQYRPYWEKEAKLLNMGKTGPRGLYPEEQYCGDIHTFVQSLNVNAEGWRAMRDLGALLSETGNKKEADYYTKEAAKFRKIVLNAINSSVDRTTSPPFVPIALSGGEPAHDPILHSRIGSYWNIIIGYTIQSGIFPSKSEEGSWIPTYQEQHGGICMGMLRGGGGEQFNFWTGEQRINPLYGTRYALNCLLRDDPERALVSFYGMLAQGLTRNTFVGGEGSSLESLDDNGRIFYCPPNSAASAHLLSMLRNMLVQDWDLDDDGIPETLRLGFATPKRWLEDGKTIEVKEAPTVFGKTSFSIHSDLAKGEIIFNYVPPVRTAKKILARIRVPEDWKITSASMEGNPLHVDEKGTVDISAITNPAVIKFKAEHR